MFPFHHTVINSKAVKQIIYIDQELNPVTCVAAKHYTTESLMLVIQYNTVIYC